MFEVTTRLPNSFAFKNQNHQKLNSSNKFPSFSNAEPYVALHSPNLRNSHKHELPIYFGQPSNNSFNTMSATNFSNSSPRLNSSPYFYEHNISHNNKDNGFNMLHNSNNNMNDIKTTKNITVLPVFYKNNDSPQHIQQNPNLPSLRNNHNSSSSSSPNSPLKSASYINKIHINGAQILPPLNNSTLGYNISNSGVNPIHSYGLNNNNNIPEQSYSNFHDQLQAHQRRLNNLDKINLANSQNGRSHSLNMNRFNNLTLNSNNRNNDNNGCQHQVIYNHDATNYPYDRDIHSENNNDNKISVIKSIKARQDQFLSKMKRNSLEEEENNRMRYNFDQNAKQNRYEDENEINLIKRNFNYLFMDNQKNNTLGQSNTYKNSENLSKLESNYRNTVNNTDAKLRSFKDRRNSIDRCRIEQNDTPLSDVSSMMSNGINNNINNLSNTFLNSKPSSSGSSNSSNSNIQKKSILSKKQNKQIKEKKSVSFAEL